MTDNEIIKALECCINSDCKSCPCNTNPRRCKEIDDDGLLALINRQKAEIERLQIELKVMRTHQAADNLVKEMEEGFSE